MFSLLRIELTLSHIRIFKLSHNRITCNYHRRSVVEAIISDVSTSMKQMLTLIRYLKKKNESCMMAEKNQELLDSNNNLGITASTTITTRTATLRAITIIINQQ